MHGKGICELTPGPYWRARQSRRVLKLRVLIYVDSYTKGCMKKVLLKLAVALGYVTYASDLFGADVTSLKFVNDIPFVALSVGAAQTTMMIDSGGALLISIPQATVERSNSVDLLEGVNKFRDVSGKEFEVRKLVARNVIIGRTKLDPIEGQLHVQWGGAAEGNDAPLTIARQSGALGIKAFGDRKVLLDYKEETLSIYGRDENVNFGSGHWIDLPLEYGKIGPNILLSVNGRKFRFILDTGARVNLVDRKKFDVPAKCPPNTHDGICDPKMIGMLSDIGGNKVSELSAEQVDLGNAPFDGILGAPFFKKNRVIFDLSGKHLYLSKLE